MRLVIERGELLRALGHVTSVVERRTTIPILSNVLLQGVGRSRSSSRRPTSSARSSRASPPTSASPARVTVPAHMLHDIVRKLPDGARSRSKRDAREGAPDAHRRAMRALRCRRCRRRTFPISPPARSATSSRSSAQRPEAPDRQDALCHLDRRDALLPQRHLSAHRRSAARRRRCARWRPTGIAWRRSSCRVPKGAEGMPGVIMPRKTVHELHRLIEDSSAAGQGRRVAAKVRFEIGTITLTSKLIDGTFPDYGRVIPQGNDKEMKVSNAEFIERRRPRVDDRQRARPRGEAQHQAGQADPVGQQPGRRQRHRGDRRRVYGAARSRSASTRAICSISPSQLESERRDVPARRSGLADHGQGRRRRERALRADADARVARGARSPAAQRSTTHEQLHALGRAADAHQFPQLRACWPLEVGPGAAGADRRQRRGQDQPARGGVAAGARPGLRRAPIPSWRAARATAAGPSRRARTRTSARRYRHRAAGRERRDSDRARPHRAHRRRDAVGLRRAGRLRRDGLADAGHGRPVHRLRRPSGAVSSTG